MTQQPRPSAPIDRPCIACHTEILKMNVYQHNVDKQACRCDLCEACILETLW